MKKIHNANVWEDEFLTSCMCFLAFLKKWKNTFLFVTFRKRVLWSWKYVQKKLVIGPDLHHKSYQNRSIFQKYTTFWNWLIFISTPRYSVVFIILPIIQCPVAKLHFFYIFSIARKIFFCLLLMSTIGGKWDPPSYIDRMKA